MVIAYVVIWAFQDLLWSDGRQPSGALDWVVVVASVSWALSAPSAALGLTGMLMWGRRSTSVPAPIPNLVSFRVVSRGQNAGALRATVENVRSAMARRPLFPYRIEVVTDMPVELPAGPDLTHYVVPGDYETPAGSRFKARALEYVLQTSELPDEAWVMHLDEESGLTPSVVDGIAVAVREEESSGTLRIGQGAILYHRDLDKHRFLTMADSMRTGDDLGRFYFQHTLGVTLFGLHGSFILVRNDVAKQVGFDFGPDGSITEDAFWAVSQMQRGVRCRWVEGYLEEQSTRSVADFIKQRRRWFIGLVLVAMKAPTKLRYRLPIAVSTAVWSVSWVGVVATYANFVVGVEIPIAVRVLGNFAFAVYILLYLAGMAVQLHVEGTRSRPSRWLHYVAVVLLIPVFSVFEGLGVVYAVARPDMTGFHVVKK